jgi:hypothetical protein
MVKKRKGWSPTYAKTVGSAAHSIGQRLRRRRMGRISSRQFARTAHFAAAAGGKVSLFGRYELSIALAPGNPHLCLVPIQLG